MSKTWGGPCSTSTRRREFNPQVPPSSAGCSTRSASGKGVTWPPRIVRMLHVEDDPIQQKMLSHHLQQIPELQFAVTCARSEDEAVAAFDAHPADFVILDYHLSQGDGLSCLRKLRRHDSRVPIIAVSGQA